MPETCEVDGDEATWEQGLARRREWMSVPGALVRKGKVSSLLFTSPVCVLSRDVYGA